MPGTWGVGTRRTSGNSSRRSGTSGGAASRMQASAGRRPASRHRPLAGATRPRTMPRRRGRMPGWPPGRPRGPGSRWPRDCIRARPGRAPGYTRLRDQTVPPRPAGRMRRPSPRDPERRRRPSTDRPRRPDVWDPRARGAGVRTGPPPENLPRTRASPVPEWRPAGLRPAARHDATSPTPPADAGTSGDPSPLAPATTRIRDSGIRIRGFP